MCHFQIQNGPYVMNKIFLVQTIINTFIYLLSLFIVQNLKKFLQRTQSYGDAPFLGTKLMTWFSEKVQKPCFWVIFNHFWSSLSNGDFFQKIRQSHTTIYGPLTPSQVSEKTNEPILKKRMDGWTEPIL